MSRRVLNMLFEAALLTRLAGGAALIEVQSLQAETQRLMRTLQDPDREDARITFKDNTASDVSDDIVMTYRQNGDEASLEAAAPIEPEQEEDETESVERSPDDNGIQLTYEEKKEGLDTEEKANSQPDVVEPVHLTGPQVSDDIVMFDKRSDSIDDADDDNAPFTPTKKDLVTGPTGPCVWFLEIAHRSQAGEPKVWRTMKVNGTKDDKFRFRGCTTVGEAGSQCVSADKILAGVRIMWNAKGEVVEFGSCCHPSLVDVIVNSRIQHCEGDKEQQAQPAKTEANEAEDVPIGNTSSWKNVIHRMTHEAPWLKQSQNLMLEAMLLVGGCLMVIISSTMYCRYKKK